MINVTVPEKRFKKTRDYVDFFPFLFLQIYVLQSLVDLLCKVHYCSDVARNTIHTDHFKTSELDHSCADVYDEWYKLKEPVG